VSGKIAEDVVDDRPLADLGLDSLMMLEVRTKLMSMLGGRPLESALTFRYPTIAAIADHLGREVLGMDVDTKSAPHGPQAATFRLFWFPFAGGGAAAFGSLWHLWPPWLEFVPIELPGHGMRAAEPPLVRMERLISALLPTLEPDVDLPFAFFGYSMGSWIAFELTRELRRRSRPLPAHLFVAARYAPQLTSPDSAIFRLDDTAFLAAITRLYGPMPESVRTNPDLLATTLSVLRADSELLSTYEYTPAPPLPCPITAFGGAEDPLHQPSSIEAWRSQTAAAFDAQIFQGGHFFWQTAKDAMVAAILGPLASYAVPRPEAAARGPTHEPGYRRKA
jgi:medium-chain acyl-[acyl-carrier-protein] hydrolase